MENELLLILDKSNDFTANFTIDNIFYTIIKENGYTSIFKTVDNKMVSYFGTCNHYKLMDWIKYHTMDKINEVIKAFR